MEDFKFMVKEKDLILILEDFGAMNFDIIG